MPRHVIIFAKAPVLGTVKTRLAAGIGSVMATCLYRTWSARVIRRLAADTRWHTALALSPDSYANGSQSWPACWPHHIDHMAQGSGDLGRRMSGRFKGLPPGDAVIVGSDIPDLEPRHIAAAFKALGRCDAVFGPASDGGYWLIGLTNRLRQRASFEGVRWSTEHAQADTIRKLGADKNVCILTEQLADIDTVDDLNAWKRQRR